MCGSWLMVSLTMCVGKRSFVEIEQDDAAAPPKLLNIRSTHFKRACDISHYSVWNLFRDAGGEVDSLASRVRQFAGVGGGEGK